MTVARRGRLGLGSGYALLAACLLLTAMVALGHNDVVASDPLWYASLSHDIATDPHQVFAAPSNHPFEMRVGLTVPLALLYRCLGVSTLVTILPCLLAALCILWVVHAAAETARAKVLAMFFAIACVPLFRNAGTLNVDLPCAALVGISVLYLSRRDRAHGAAWTAAAMIAWFAAFLMKESALWALPVWLYAVAIDLRCNGTRQMLRRFTPALALGLGLTSGYLVLCGLVWGHPLARFSGVSELGGQHDWSLAGEPASAWIERLGWGPPLLLAKMFRLELVPLLLAPWLLPSRAWLWWVTAIAILLQFWFGSASLSSFDPLPLLPRMILPILPALLVVAAAVADRTLDTVARRWPEAGWPRWVATVLALAVIVPSASSIRHSISLGRPDSAAYARLRIAIAATAKPVVLVCGSYPCAALSSFHFGFAPPPRVTVVTSQAFAAAPPPIGAAVFAIDHAVRTVGSSAVDTRYLALFQAEPTSLRLLMRDRDVRLYEAGDGVRLHQVLRDAVNASEPSPSASE